ARDSRGRIPATNWQSHRLATTDALLSASRCPNKKRLRCRADNAHAWCSLRSSAGAEGQPETGRGQRFPRKCAGQVYESGRKRSDGQKEIERSFPKRKTRKLFDSFPQFVFEMGLRV